MNPLVRRLAQLTILAAIVLLVLGGLTTSFRAGMADPVWPTEPWFLIVNGHKYELEQHRGFLLEHTHRAAGFTVGALASLLALSAWMSGPKKASRLLGVVAVVALLACYGDLHRRMMAAWELRRLGQGFAWPKGAIYSSLASAGLLLFASFSHLLSKQPGKWVRFLASVILIAVMIQGLLGGLRVFLDTELGISQTLGVELAAIHGVFAQVVFAAMVCVPMLCRQPLQGPPLSTDAILRLSILLPAVVFLQLIWAAWVRHAPSPLAQRLHFITAFAVVGLAVWLCTKVYSRPDTRKAFGFSAFHLVLILGVQIILGVEAWMGKFAAQGPSGMIPPELRQVTTHSASIRTLHQLIGAAILASSVALAVRICRKRSVTYESVASEENSEVATEHAIA
jgi:cytochrome c oxidase assembly protein subunit 15